MRYLSAVAFLVFALFCVAALTGGQARAAVLPPAPLAGPASAKLNQVSAGTWTTTVYLDTTALCLGPTSFDLLTGTPDTDTPDPNPDYVGGLQCAAQARHPVTEVVLSFTPSPALSSVPESATLAVTQPPSAIDQGATPLELSLDVRRQVSQAQYLWIPAGCGVALAALLVVLTMLAGVPKPGGRRVHMHRVDFWRSPLYASSAWTFGDSWATNITAVGAVVGTVLTASGSVAELLPGLELGRFSLLIALAGGITVVAPLLFSVLNYRYSRQDPTTAGVVAICLPGHAKRDEGIMIGVPAGGSLAVHGQVTADGDGARPAPPLSPDTTVDIPAGAVVTVSAGAGAANTACQRVVVFPGDTNIVVTPGQRVTFGVPVTASGAPAPLPAGTALLLGEGATLSFLGQANIKVPADAHVEAPAEASVEKPDDAPRRPAASYPRQFVIPRGTEVVAARMWSMLAASCLTVFGIGAEIGVIGWVLGYNLIVAPQWARVCSALVAAVAAALVLGYGVSAIRSLADMRQGTSMSSSRGSSFML